MGPPEFTINYLSTSFPSLEVPCLSPSPRKMRFCPDLLQNPKRDSVSGTVPRITITTTFTSCNHRDLKLFWALIKSILSYKLMENRLDFQFKWVFSLKTSPHYIKPCFVSRCGVIQGYEKVAVARKIKTHLKEKNKNPCSLQALYNWKCVLNMSTKCGFYRRSSTAAAATSAPPLKCRLNTSAHSASSSCQDQGRF